MEKENIFSWKRRKRRKVFFAKENNNGEGTGGKYLENIYFVEEKHLENVFCGGEKTEIKLKEKFRRRKIFFWKKWKTEKEIICIFCIAGYL